MSEFHRINVYSSSCHHNVPSNLYSSALMSNDAEQLGKRLLIETNAVRLEELHDHEANKKVNDISHHVEGHSKRIDSSYDNLGLKSGKRFFKISAFSRWFANRRQNVQRLIQDLLSPSVTQNNIKLFGSEKAIEEEKIRTRQSYVIHPLSNLRQFWDLLIMLVMLFNLFILPLDVAFHLNALRSFLTMSDILCLLDIILNFRTGYIIFPEANQIELGSRKIMKNYFKTWLFVDLVGSIPLQFIIITFFDRDNSVSVSVKSASHVLKYWKLIKLLRLLKVVRLSRVIRSVKMYEEVYRLTTVFMRYIKLVFMMMIIAHWNGCIHFMIPMLQGFPKNSWIMLCGIRDEKWYIQYGWGLFKTLSHMLSIGYGRFIPELLSEASITLFTMITGATFYALFIANSMAYIIESDYSKITYREKLKGTKEYLAYRHVPDELGNKVEAYYNQKYRHGRYFDEDVVLSQLSKPIRESITRHVCKDLLTDIPIFQDASCEVISSVLETVSSDVYLPGDIISNEDGRECELYFVRSGQVEISINNMVIETLCKGEYLGEINLLVKEKGLYTARALTVCDIVIFSEQFTFICEQHSSIGTLIEHVAITRILSIYNKCMLDNIFGKPNSTLENEHSTQTALIKQLKLFEKYLHVLIYRIEGKKEDVDVDAYYKTSSDVNDEAIKALFKRLIQCHERSHNCFDIALGSE